MRHEEPPFYDKVIFRGQEQDYIKKLLEKYRKDPADDALKKKIWDDLQKEKAEGRITIPFKVVLRKDSYGRYPAYIEIILDSKV